MKHEPHYEHSNWLKRAIRIPELRKEVWRAWLRLRGRKFDAIAFRGMSGALFAPSLALRMHKTLIMVRKPKTSHTSRIIEGDLGARTYLIVDDLIDTGKTVAAIRAEIKDLMPNAVCVGAYLYDVSERPHFRVPESLKGYKP